MINVFDSNGVGAVVSMKIYELTSSAGMLDSRYMDLNGQTLTMPNDNSLLCLVDCPRSEQGDNLMVKPYTIVYLDVEPANINNICS